jgi:murein DD-endopeptidase MepM/ murein hydrolase activator NlpD
MKKLLLVIVTLAVLFTAATQVNSFITKGKVKISLEYKLKTLVEDTYRFPLGDSLGRGYYIAQKFQDSKMNNGTHLGIDVSGIGKYNSDFGDTIYSINNGYVTQIQPDHKEYLAIYYKLNNTIIKTVYLHCNEVFCDVGDYVIKGQPIATVGNSDGAYAAHLHLEMMSDTSLWYGGYGLPDGFIDPETIIPHYSTINK